MLKPVKLCVDYMNLGSSSCDKVVSSTEPVFSWGGYTDQNNNFQTAYSIVVKNDEDIFWESGVVSSASSFAKYEGKPLPLGERIDFGVSIAGNDGVLSDFVYDYFYVGALNDVPPAKWICASEDEESVPAYFKKTVVIDKEIQDAFLYVSAAGFCDVRLNGSSVNTGKMMPSFTDYTKTSCYAFIPELADYFHVGENKIDIALADGWRRNNGDYLTIYNNTPSFFGVPVLWAVFKITFKDKTVQWVTTDESWKWSRGQIVFSHLFDGETYDATKTDFTLYPVKLYEEKTGELRLMSVPHIREYKVFNPLEILPVDKGKYIVDFGTNMSGVVRLRLPSNMDKGHAITIRHGQILKDDGTLNTDTLRGAKSTDTYICSGKEDGQYYEPVFTYHGFRYVEITGFPLLTKDDICAVMLCTELESRLKFKSGSAVANAIHSALLQTELSTTHGALNDTCGRSERMHWLDDGIIRYPEVAYNFEISRLFPHMLMLIRDTQNPDGSITCTAPHIYGKRPGDPLSSSYLMLAEELYNRCGNIKILSEYYDSFCLWEKCLVDNSTDYIIDYSYYGDWAGPEYSRDKNTMGGGAGSATIPQVMVGTGLFMHNARLLKKFARILGKPEDEKYYDELYTNVKNAFLNKWYDSKTKKVFNGCQSCQALALWLDVIPKEDEIKVAKIMRDDLVNSGYRFTTGAFCLKFMCEMLVKFGYVNEFYTLMTREEYPSLGYMLQMGATTGWEKYEYLTGSSMNAHIHALQISVFHLFYKLIGGLESFDTLSGEFFVHPHYPKDLHTMQTVHSTVFGDLSVSWSRRNGVINLKVCVPFNTCAHISTPDGVNTVGCGLYSFEWKE